MTHLPPQWGENTGVCPPDTGHLQPTSARSSSEVLHRVGHFSSGTLHNKQPSAITVGGRRRVVGANGGSPLSAALCALAPTEPCAPHQHFVAVIWQQRLLGHGTAAAGTAPHRTASPWGSDRLTCGRWQMPAGLRRPVVRAVREMVLIRLCAVAAAVQHERAQQKAGEARTGNIVLQQCRYSRCENSGTLGSGGSVCSSGTRLVEGSVKGGCKSSMHGRSAAASSV